MVNKNLAWFRTLLEHTLPEETLPNTLMGKDRLKVLINKFLFKHFLGH